MKRGRVYFVQCVLNVLNDTQFPTMHSAVSAFIEQMGLACEANGLSRIAGRMLGYLLIDDEPHSLDELVEQLQVSKASVSTNARLLEHYGIIERHSVPGDRRDYYRIGEHPWAKIQELSRQRLLRTQQAFERGLAEIPAEMEDMRRRLETWYNFHTFLLEEIENKLRRWEEHLANQAKRAEQPKEPDQR